MIAGGVETGGSERDGSGDGQRVGGALAGNPEEAEAGFERWKARHAAIVADLQPTDVLVDGMRGRSTLWYRIRVNLEHVPESERPEQEPLEVDYDPWAAYEWPDRSDQLARAPRKKKTTV